MKKYIYHIIALCTLGAGILNSLTANGQPPCSINEIDSIHSNYDSQCEGTHASFSGILLHNYGGTFNWIRKDSLPLPVYANAIGENIDFTAFNLSDQNQYGLIFTDSVSGCTDTAWADDYTIYPTPVVCGTVTKLCDAGLAFDVYDCNDTSGTGTIVSWLNDHGVWVVGNAHNEIGPGYFFSNDPCFPAYLTHTPLVQIANAGGCLAVKSFGTYITAPCVNPFLPLQPGVITAVGGNKKVCGGDTVAYSVPLDTAAKDYTWTPAPGSIILSGQGTNAVIILYTSAFTVSDTLRVVANNKCGSGPERYLRIRVDAPISPGTITGTRVGLCGRVNVPYSVVAVAGLTYNWALTPGCGTIVSGQGTHLIRIDFSTSFVSGMVTVTANNGCGPSAVNKLSVKGVPNHPGTITGPQCVQANSTGNAYSIPAVSFATSYTWTGPSGSHITGNGITSTGNTLNTPATSVTVSFVNITATSKILVRSNNLCGTSPVKSKALVLCPARVSANETMTAEVFPNPSNTDVTIKFNSGQAQKCKVSVVDLTGRNVIVNDISASAGSNEFTIDLSAVANGLYFVQLKLAEGAQTLRVVKE